MVVGRVSKWPISYNIFIDFLQVYWLGSKFSISFPIACFNSCHDFSFLSEFHLAMANHLLSILEICCLPWQDYLLVRALNACQCIYCPATCHILLLARLKLKKKIFNSTAGYYWYPQYDWVWMNNIFATWFSFLC